MRPLRLIMVIVAANFAGGVISLGLGSALISHSLNFFQSGLILLGVSINMTVGNAIGVSRRADWPQTPALTGFETESPERARRGQPDV